MALSLSFPFDVVLVMETVEESSFGNARVDCDGNAVLDVNARDRILEDLSLPPSCLSQSSVHV